jgi:hypothetical protein
LPKDPCAGCGEATAVGSVHYSGRHIIQRADGATTHLCGSCDALLRASRPGRRLSDDEIRDLDPNGIWATVSTLRTGVRD